MARVAILNKGLTLKNKTPTYLCRRKFLHTYRRVFVLKGVDVRPAPFFFSACSNIKELASETNS